ncbi:copper chaperone [Brevibacterium paucivorans]|uniref:Heavy metal-associated domain protein n=2 Tax=Brevibacterium TaxID=1696 RepID=D4YKZ3_9MICO|nr:MULTISPECIES: heavy metal-associated domain-containing protein [Brevibacterium]EFG48087.1 heavy metal-associated domain protein [Brevibacterium mcbrellneri ATCC 49030]MBM7816384.1 copper chaperone [Brevibacterium paucivorans]PMD04828.1 copper-exporting P-type ATPase CopA [Brevibacterium paucivorans]
MPISTFSVSGMTCEHCVRAVKQEVGDISGVTQVEVELGTPSTVTVQSTEPISHQDVVAAIDEAGYEVV